LTLSSSAHVVVPPAIISSQVWWFAPHVAGHGGGGDGDGEGGGEGAAGGISISTIWNANSSASPVRKMRS